MSLYSQRVGVLYIPSWVDILETTLDDVIDDAISEAEPTETLDLLAVVGVREEVVFPLVCLQEGALVETPHILTTVAQLSDAADLGVKRLRRVSSGVKSSIVEAESEAGV